MPVRGSSLTLDPANAFSIVGGTSPRIRCVTQSALDPNRLRIAFQRAAATFSNSIFTV